MAIYAMALGRDQIKPAINAAMESGIEAASQSFKKGAMLITSAGKLKIAAASSSAFRNVIGIAANAATGTASSTIKYYPIEDTEFTAVVNGSTASSGHVLAQADIGADFAAALDASTGVFYVNRAVGSAAKSSFVVMRAVDPVGTAAGRVVVRFKRVTDTAWPTIY